MSRPLVLVAHGSRNAAAAEAVTALAEAVRQQRPGLRVAASYLDHAEPPVGTVLSAVGAGAVVVPLLLTAAFHSRVDLPAVLGAADPTAVQAGVLGPHPLLLTALERRLGEAGVPAGDPRTAVVLAAAGSTDARARASVRRLARDWGTRGWWDVRAAFASAGLPTVAAAVATLIRDGAPRVAVASYLLAPGQFADRVTADGVQAGADPVSRPLGDAPEVAAVVLARYDAAPRTRSMASIGP